MKITILAWPCEFTITDAFKWASVFSSVTAESPTAREKVRSEDRILWDAEMRAESFAKWQMRNVN